MVVAFSAKASKKKGRLSGRSAVFRGSRVFWVMAHLRTALEVHTRQPAMRYKAVNVMEVTKHE